MTKHRNALNFSLKVQDSGEPATVYAHINAFGTKLRLFPQTLVTNGAHDRIFPSVAWGRKFSTGQYRCTQEGMCNRLQISCHWVQPMLFELLQLSKRDMPFFSMIMFGISYRWSSLTCSLLWTFTGSQIKTDFNPITLLICVSWFEVQKNSTSRVFWICVRSAVWHFSNDNILNANRQHSIAHSKSCLELTWGTDIYWIHESFRFSRHLVLLCNLTLQMWKKGRIIFGKTHSHLSGL